MAGWRKQSNMDALVGAEMDVLVGGDDRTWMFL